MTLVTPRQEALGARLGGLSHLLRPCDVAVTGLNEPLLYVPSAAA